MKISGPFRLRIICCAVVLATGCSQTAKNVAPSTGTVTPATSFFRVDPNTAGSVSGTVRYSGSRPPRQLVNMSSDPACVETHHGKAYDESLVTAPNGALANAFVYIKKGLEGKSFEVPASPVTIDQSGCWFHPRVLGIQTNQVLEIVNSDPVTHNIHPMAEVNREWNHSQGSGDAPLHRKFLKPEVMIRVKCNIHSWMHAYIGVLDHPYFAVTQQDGTFEIKNLPPGTYTLALWQEDMGEQEQQITIPPKNNTAVDLIFKGK